MSTAAIRPEASERWFGPGSSMGRASRTMILIALASLAGHLLMVVAALLASRSPPAAPQEISVEIVQDVPRPTSQPPKPVSGEKKAPAEDKKPSAAAERVAAEVPPAAKPPPPPAPKAEPAKPEKAAAPPPRPQPRPQVDAADKKLAALQKELETLRAEQASLRTEQASLQAEHAADEAATRAPAQAPLRDAGLGPLPESFQAVALPAANDGAGEATSYQEIVFSALAKAKGFGRTKGLPGSAGVRFSVDAAGRLVDVELVQKSGVPSLDAEALDIVRRAAPFPPPPQGAQRSFSANVNFVTEGAP